MQWTRRILWGLRQAKGSYLRRVMKSLNHLADIRHLSSSQVRRVEPVQMRCAEVRYVEFLLVLQP